MAEGRIDAERSRSETLGLRVACAQLVARELKDCERALEEALAAVAEAASVGAAMVVLPECTYPAYVLADPSIPPRLRADAEVEQAFSNAAREHRMWVAVGLAQAWRPGVGGARNAAVLFGPDGDALLRTAKRFLWDFDGRWFTPGPPSDPVALAGIDGADIGSVGMLVCADARMPEIARSLAVAGARLILDPTAWVASGRDPAALSNPQPEYLMSVRALENGVWIAAADKVGMERGAVVYAGRSCVIAPDGSVAAMASSAEPEIVWADVDLAVATGPPVARRPELYGSLISRIDDAPVCERLNTPVVARDAVSRVGLLQSGGAASDVGTIGRRLGELRAMADALGLDVVAATANGDAIANAWLADAVATDAKVTAAIALADDVGIVRAVHVVSDGSHRVLVPTHGPAATPHGSLADRSLDVGPLRLSTIVGPEGLVPEVARVVCLEGAELLLWFADGGTPLLLEVARVRAVENRVWVGIVSPADGGDGVGEAMAALVDPEGRVVSVGLRGRDHLVSGIVNVALARLKQMAPGTDVLTGRQPESYGILVEAQGGDRS